MINLNFVYDVLKRDATQKVWITSRQFHQRLKLAFFIQLFCQSQNVTRKSCHKRLSYKKAREKRWWNWHLETSITSSCYSELQVCIPLDGWDGFLCCLFVIMNHTFFVYISSLRGPLFARKTQPWIFTSNFTQKRAQTPNSSTFHRRSFAIV